MGVRIRGRDGDVREIKLPMPGKFIKEDTSCLEWLTRPADKKKGSADTKKDARS